MVPQAWQPTLPGWLEGLCRLGFAGVFDTNFAADLTIMEEGQRAAGAAQEGPGGEEEGRAAHHTHNTAKLARLHDSACLGHDRTVGPMMSDQQARAAHVCRRDQRFSLRDRWRNRLLKQAGDSSFNALQRLWHMQLVRSGQNDAVGSRLLKQVLQRTVKRYSGGAGDCVSLR